MYNASLENRMQSIQARLQAEIDDDRERDSLPLEIQSELQSPRHGSGRRPTQLCELGNGRADGTPTRSKRGLNLQIGMTVQQRNQDGGEIESKLQEIMKMNGIINISGKKYQTEIKDLEHQGELGNGTCGHVVKMLHKPSHTVIAVKQMRRSGNAEENKRIIMDLDVVLKSHDCPFIVQCLGCFITESDVWICMELMATCFDKLLKRLKQAIPEDILGKVTVATVKALHYLKESHGVIHRDVKPSNILLDEKGNVKLCDFGISGRLVDSKAKTRSAGCAAYMAPERIDPPDPTKPDYDIRADVWSLGITLVELATGVFPYKDCKTDFEVLSKVLQDDPPSLPEDQNFSPEFREFVTCCLTKNYRFRPKYRKLLEHPFIRKYETANVNVAEWFSKALQQCESHLCNSPQRRLTPPSGSPSPRRHNIFHHRSASETTKPNGEARRHPVELQRVISDPTRLTDAQHNNSYKSLVFFHGQNSEYSREPVGVNQESNVYVGSQMLNSDHPARKRFPSEPHNGPLQRYYGYVQPAPCCPTEFINEQGKPGPEDKKRFASYLKFRLEPRRLPPPHPTRHQPADPPAWGQFGDQQHRCSGGRPVEGAQLQRLTSEPNSYSRVYQPVPEFHRYNSEPHRYSQDSGLPSPPPRLNRISSEGSPMRRSFLDASPVRRGFPEGSPSLSRRYVSPSPPQPPPRRLSESSSVPGSPQHRRVDHHFRARLHYTPEPQRRVFGGEFPDL